MDLTCSQVEMLLSFYYDGDLKDNLKSKVEEHLEVCPVCKEKYRLLTELLRDLKDGVAEITKQKRSSEVNVQTETREQVDTFQGDYRENLSAYVDSELSDDDNIKVKKITIQNKNARNYLENSYALKHVLKNAYEKTKADVRKDYTKNVLSVLDIEGQEYVLNPVIKVIAVLSIIALFGAVFVAIVLNVAW